MPCGIAERIPDAEIVSNDNAVAPCFFIKNSKSSAISLSVTPSLILPKIYSNAISPIFSASAIFLISHSSFISRGLFIRFCISTKSCPSFSFALIRLFSPTLIYDSSKPIYFSSILENIFSKPFAISITSKPFACSRACIVYRESVIIYLPLCEISKYASSDVKPL